MIRVFIGYDSRENVAFNVASNSIQRHASRPVQIAQVRKTQLGGIYNRTDEKLSSTEFSFSRFLVPYLCDYEGWAIFMDCDVLLRDDIAKLWDLRDENYAVMCVKHDHQPKTTIKFLGAEQTQYPKKNWSSVMMLNCAKCKNLTPEFVNTASGLELHQFKWLESDDMIADVGLNWNFLADYYHHTDNAKLIHYTEGGPYFEDYRTTDYAEDWFKEFEDATQALGNDLYALTDYAKNRRN